MLKVFRLSILCVILPVVSVFTEHVRTVSAMEFDGQTLDVNPAEQHSQASLFYPDVNFTDPSEVASKSLSLTIPDQEYFISPIELTSDNRSPARANPDQSLLLEVQPIKKIAQSSGELISAPESLQTATQISPAITKSTQTLPTAPTRVLEITTTPVASLGAVDILPRLPVNLNPLATIPSSIPQSIENVSPAPPQSIAQTESTVVVPNPYRQDGIYITAYGIPIQGRGFAQDFIGRATFDNDYGVGAAIGYRTRDYRIDLEYSYFTNNFKELFFFIPGTTTIAPNQPETSPGASVTGQAYMLNAYYDIPVGSEQFRPYIGGGIGFYNARINQLSPPGFGGFVANGSSPNRFAYQLRAGVNYAVARNFEIFTGYRYLQGSNFEYTIENSGNPPLVLRPNGLKSDSWEVGLRYTF